MADRLADVWMQRDQPVLVACAELCDQAIGAAVLDREVAAHVGLDEDDVKRALIALTGPYLVADVTKSFGGHASVVVTGLTERGRRTAGLWPDGEAADVLVEALRQAEAATDDVEEKSTIRRALGGLGGMSRDVLTDILATVVKAQTGI